MVPLSRSTMIGIMVFILLTFLGPLKATRPFLNMRYPDQCRWVFIRFYISVLLWIEYGDILQEKH